MFSQTLFITPIAYIIGLIILELIKDTITAENQFVFYIYTIIYTILYNLVYYLVLVGIMHTTFDYAIIQTIILQVFLNLFIAVVFYPMFEKTGEKIKGEFKSNNILTRYFK